MSLLKHSLYFPVLLLLLIYCTRLSAHEFWLEPDNYIPQVDSNIALTMKVGENFKGILYTYMEDRFYKFTGEQNGKAKNIEGLDGDDYPAATIKFSGPRLAIIAYHSKSFELTHETKDDFKAFLEQVGQKRVLRRHTFLKKPVVNIEERYYRASKLLLNVGNSENGQDRYTGMPLELIAELNPYHLKKNARLPLLLLYQGRPVSEVLVTAFSESDTAPVQKSYTDENGRAMISLPSSGAWLINAVYIVEPATDEDVDWVSFWASMTFKRP